MAFRIVRTSRGTGGGAKIFIGLCMMIAFGGALGAGWEDITSGQDEFIGPMILCVLFVLAGLWLLISGIRTAKQTKTVTSAAEDAEAFFEQMRQEQGNMESRMDSFMRSGTVNGYQVNRTTKRVVRTTVNGTTTTTETTTSQSSGSFPGATQPELTEVTVTCAACGGTNQLRVHEIGSCQYCGSRIQG